MTVKCSIKQILNLILFEYKPTVRFQQQKNRISYLMQKTNAKSQIEGDSSANDSLHDLLLKQFQEIFSKHQHLPTRQAFLLQAAELHLNYLRLQDEIVKQKREVSTLQGMIKMQQGQNNPLKTNKKSDTSELNEAQHKKRQRRIAGEIARHYVCTVDNCNKSYGSEGSLNQHMKLKHQSHYRRHILMLNMSQSNNN